ncbi:MAG: usg protein [Beijerinckiaceae bacterium]
MDKGPVKQAPRVSQDFIRQLAGYGLTTAEILYRLPDHPRFLQTYIWQDYDIAPDFPTLMKFLAFWRDRLEGPLFSVQVAHEKLLRPAEIRTVGLELRLQ